MLTYPRFKPTYEVQIREDGVLLVDGDRYLVLRGQVCLALAPYLDGRHRVEEIVASLAEHVPAAELYFTLMRMEDAGHLVEGGATPAAAVWLADPGRAPSETSPTLETRRIGVQALDGIDPEPLHALLEASGLRLAEPGDLLVVMARDYLDPALDELNRTAIRDRQSYLLAQLSPTGVWLGPLVVPCETACWRCLAHRLRGNRPAHQLLREASRDQAPDVRAEPLASMMSTAHAMIATEAARWAVAPDDHPLRNGLVSFDAKKLEMHRHRVVRRPQCPACGQPMLLTEPKPVVLQPRPRPRRLDTGWRTRSARETLDRFEPLVSPITGVVRSIRRLPVDGTDLVHNYTVGHAMQLAQVTLRTLRHNTRDQSGGKGRTDEQARASGLCEALERSSAVFQGDEPRIESSLTKLGPEAIHPNACMLFSERQFETREAWNATLSGTFQEVPERFDPSAPVSWSPVWSLNSHRFRYLPTAYCYYGFQGPGEDTCWCDSNGLAGGNCLEEAILQGYFELVERDAVAIWWYNRTRHPAIELSAWSDPYFVELTAYYRSIGRELWAIDVTTDLGIPTVVALSRRVSGDTEDIILGFGAHASARIALHRAISEVNQTLPTILRTPEEREAQLLPDFEDPLVWWKTATVENQPYLVADDTVRPRTEADYPEVAPEDLEEEVNRCVAHAARCGLEVLVLDLTRPDLGFSVARVFVPGLRHFWKRLAPGRLYDVPVSLGRIGRANREEALNPIPLFL